MAHPIAAIATGLTRSGIGILRMSGDGCIELANRVFSLYSEKSLRDLPDRKLSRGTLFDAQGRPIDEAMVFVSRAPHSYTGEDTAEFQCHGSPAVLTAGLSALFAAGFRQAGPGEFTKRAFLNGQMDLTQAEAVIDLIDAETADAAANAAGQVAGVLRKRLDPIYDSLMDICSHFHAVLDYPDEDIEPFQLQSYTDTLKTASRQLDTLLSSCRRGNFIKNGVQTAILGAPNAGKSSLLNALAGFERVIVTAIPGTTRDAVEQTVTLGRHLLRLLDTAGIRETDDTVEQLGPVLLPPESEAQVDVQCAERGLRQLPCLRHAALHRIQAVQHAAPGGRAQNQGLGGLFNGVAVRSGGQCRSQRRQSQGGSMGPYGKKAVSRDLKRGAVGGPRDGTARVFGKETVFRQHKASSLAGAAGTPALRHRVLII